MQLRQFKELIATFQGHIHAKAGFFGFTAKGKPIVVQAINFYRLVDDQIVEEYGQPDRPGLLRQIGAIPV